MAEELEPYLEDAVLRIAAQNGIKTPVYGKRSDTCPDSGNIPGRSVRHFVLVKVQEFHKTSRQGADTPSGRAADPLRECPHRGTFAAVKRAVGNREVVYCSDIGCYTLGVQAPFHEADFIICMGGGAGAAGGFSQTTDQMPIAFIGDSTFFHSGIPPLISALFNNHKIKMIIMDNRTTAMTGHQPNPGTGREFGGISTEPVDIAKLVEESEWDS